MMKQYLFSSLQHQKKSPTLPEAMPVDGTPKKSNLHLVNTPQRLLSIHPNIPPFPCHHIPVHNPVRRPCSTKGHTGTLNIRGLSGTQNPEIPLSTRGVRSTQNPRFIPDVVQAEKNHCRGSLLDQRTCQSPEPQVTPDGRLEYNQKKRVRSNKDEVRNQHLKL